MIVALQGGYLFLKPPYEMFKALLGHMPSGAGHDEREDVNAGHSQRARIPSNLSSEKEPCRWQWQGYSRSMVLLVGGGRGTVGKRAGPKWPKMVKTTILVKMTLFRTGF